MPPKKPSTRKATPKRTPVEAIKHKDKRANIPTEELRDFVAEDEKTPETLLYPRDPSLDPQLVWKGKDEQDREALAVAAVPIYIQEKIHPQVVVEQVRAQARREQPESQIALFGDFNGLSFQDLIDFYRHEQSWTNRVILGDSLLVMFSLAEKEGMKGKVQMIYMDPPYGIKFGSNWQVSTRKRDVKDGRAEDATREPEQIKAFRDTWQLGIHSYLAYLRDRLVASRELLTQSGSVFVQIGEENVHLVRSLMDEVLGSENYCATILFRKTSMQTDALLGSNSDYILWYAKDKAEVKFREVFSEEPTGSWGADQDLWVKGADGKRRRLSPTEKQGAGFLTGEMVFRHRSAESTTGGASSGFDVLLNGRGFVPSGSKGWSTSQAGMDRLKKADRLIAFGKSLRFIVYFADFPLSQMSTIWGDTMISGFAENKLYVVQTTTKVIERCLHMTTDPGDLVLDPTCGSGTSAYVAEQWGRRWIMIDTSRVAVALARTRLMSARYPYYVLVDSPDGVVKEAEISGHAPSALLPRTEGDVRRGFVYKRAPHITLKSIANNEEIDEIHPRFQERLETLRGELNKVLKQKWEEWEMPRESDAGWAEAARHAHAEWWRLRRERQGEIDASIARRADVELLYDQPYESPKKLRVTGPFTVESLSPHRVLGTDVDRPATEREAQKHVGPGQFETMILDNLRAAGVQNTVKNERLKLDRLEPYAGRWIQATGEYSEKGKSRRAAVCIGPEHGTVGADLVKDAAKEAVQGVGFDLLIVCGFAFDPHVSEEAKRYGKLVVLPARINPDLQMGDELLKKTGAGNLFMVFGEPDMAIEETKDGKLTVEVRGLDVYDPTTGQIRSSGTDDIACWFIDTDYNGESFFVRHAYFTGAGDPYERLKRALRAEVDEAAWAALYSTKSYPFDPPSTGKIAVKVINHYGDEVLKVCEVSQASV